MPDAPTDTPATADAPAAGDDEPVVEPSPPSGRFAEWIAVAIVAVVVAIPLRGLLRAPGPPMEEGFMLVFPERFLHGDVPNRDYLHLYGPGSVWALAGTFKVFGVSLWSERLFGLAQQLAIIGGIYLLARRWGRTLAVSCAVASALIIVPFGLTALAWVGAVGLGVCGLAAGIQARAEPDGRRAGRWAVLGGLLLGFAVLFRLDLVVAVGLSGLALVWKLDGHRRARMIAGFALGVAPYLVHLAMAGVGNAWRGMVIEPVFDLRGGRSLPVPPSWDKLDGFLQKAGAIQQLDWPVPHPSTSQQLFIWFFLLIAVVAFLLWQAWQCIKAEPASIRARTLLVVALFSVGIMPQAMQRVDSAHFAWVSCVPVSFLPVALYELVTRRAPSVRPHRVALAGGIATIALLVFVIPDFTATRYTDYSLQTFNRHRNSFKIEHEGRVFYYGKADRAAAAQQVVEEAARISQPGQKLFVGPSNLRKTPYSDAYLYYLLPRLKPGTHYIEMDPGVANADDSGLDEDLRTSDIAILSRIWEDWEEPNDSRQVGSDKTARVLTDHFCHVGTYLELYELYQRCR